MSSEPVVSIVVPTCNRLSRLQRCVEQVRRNVGLPYDMILVDGASADGTIDWLRTQTDIRCIFEPQREGAVRAFNKGFRAAEAEYVMWLNDDSYPLPGAVEAAVAMLRRPDLPDLGMVAFYHNWDRRRNVLDWVDRGGERYLVYAVRGYPYANFGLLRRTLLEDVGFADERYYFFAFDPDLSLKVQLLAGKLVIGCPDALIHHEEYHDERKLADLDPGREDNLKLFAKWSLPAPGAYADPAPAYRQMLRERQIRVDESERDDPTGNVSGVCAECGRSTR